MTKGKIQIHFPFAHSYFPFHFSHLLIQNSILLFSRYMPYGKGKPNDQKENKNLIFRLAIRIFRFIFHFSNLKPDFTMKSIYMYVMRAVRMTKGKIQIRSDVNVIVPAMNYKPFCKENIFCQFPRLQIGKGVHLF